MYLCKFVIMTSLARVLRNYQITLPKPLREKFRVKEGDLVKIEETRGGLFVTPVETIDRDQTWFWTPEWQEGEKKVDDERKKGKVKNFKNIDDFVKDLKK